MNPIQQSTRINGKEVQERDSSVAESINPKPSEPRHESLQKDSSAPLPVHTGYLCLISMWGVAAKYNAKKVGK